MSEAERFGLYTAFDFSVSSQTQRSVSWVLEKLGAIEQAVGQTSNAINNSRFGNLFEQQAQSAASSTRAASQAVKQLTDSSAAARQRLRPLKDEFRAIRAATRNLNFGDLTNDRQFRRASEEARVYIRSIRELEHQVQGTTAVEREFTETLKRQAVAIKTQLDLQREQRDAAKAAERTGQFQSLRKVGVAAIKPLYQQGKAATDIYAGFSDQMSEVAAITQASASEFESLQGKAKQLGGQTRFTAKQVAEAEAALGSAGFKVNEILTGIGPTLNMASAGALDLGESAGIASSTLRGMKMQVEELGYASDVLAYIAAATNSNIQQTGVAMEYVAPNAAIFGASLSETVAILGAMSNASIAADKGGTALRSMFLRLADPPKKGKAAIAEFGLTLTDSQGNMRNIVELLDEISTKLQLDPSALNEISSISEDNSEALDALAVSQSRQIRALSGLFGTTAVSGAAAALSQIDEIKRLAIAAQAASTPTEELTQYFTQLKGLKLDPGQDLFAAIVAQAPSYTDAVSQINEANVNLMEGHIRALDPKQAAALRSYLVNVKGFQMAPGDDLLTTLIAASPNANAAIAQVTGALDNLGIQLDREAGAAKTMALVMENNLAGSFRSLSSAFEAVQIGLIEPLAPLIRAVTDTLTKLLLFIANLPAPVRSAIAVGVGLVGVMSALAVAIGFAGAAAFGFSQALATSNAAAIALSRSAIPLTGFFQSSMLAFRDTNPIEGLARTWTRAFDDFGGAVRGNVGEAGELVSEFRNRTLQAARSVYLLSRAFLLSPWGIGIVAFVGLNTILNQVVPGLNLLGAALSALAAPFGFLYGLVKGLLESVLNVFGVTLQGAFAPIAPILKGINEAIAQAIRTFGQFADKGEAAGKLIGDVIVGAMRSVGGTVTAIWNMTIAAISRPLIAFVDFAKMIGYMLVGALAEHSPGTTWQIRQKWAMTIEFLFGLFRNLGSFAVRTGQFLTTTLTLAGNRFISALPQVVEIAKNLAVAVRTIVTPSNILGFLTLGVVFGAVIPKLVGIYAWMIRLGQQAFPYVQAGVEKLAQILERIKFVLDTVNQAFVGLGDITTEQQIEARRRVFETFIDTITVAANAVAYLGAAFIRFRHWEETTIQNAINNFDYFSFVLLTLSSLPATLLSQLEEGFERILPELTLIAGKGIPRAILHALPGAVAYAMSLGLLKGFQQGFSNALDALPGLVKRLTNQFYGIFNEQMVGEINETVTDAVRLIGRALTGSEVSFQFDFLAGQQAINQFADTALVQFVNYLHRVGDAANEVGANLKTMLTPLLSFELVNLFPVIKDIGLLNFFLGGLPPLVPLLSVIWQFEKGIVNLLQSPAITGIINFLTGTVLPAVLRTLGGIAAAIGYIVDLLVVLPVRAVIQELTKGLTSALGVLIAQARILLPMLPELARQAVNAFGRFMASQVLEAAGAIAALIRQIPYVGEILATVFLNTIQLAVAAFPRYMNLLISATRPVLMQILQVSKAWGRVLGGLLGGVNYFIEKGLKPLGPIIARVLDPRSAFKLLGLYFRTGGFQGIIRKGFMSVNPFDLAFSTQFGQLLMTGLKVAFQVPFPKDIVAKKQAEIFQVLANPTAVAKQKALGAKVGKNLLVPMVEVLEGLPPSARIFVELLRGVMLISPLAQIISRVALATFFWYSVLKPLNDEFFDALANTRVFGVRLTLLALALRGVRFAVINLVDSFFYLSFRIPGMLSGVMRTFNVLGETVGIIVHEVSGITSIAANLIKATIINPFLTLTLAVTAALDATLIVVRQALITIRNATQRYGDAISSLLAGNFSAVGTIIKYLFQDLVVTPIRIGSYLIQQTLGRMLNAVLNAVKATFIEIYRIIRDPFHEIPRLIKLAADSINQTLGAAIAKVMVYVRLLQLDKLASVLWQIKYGIIGIGTAVLVLTGRLSPVYLIIEGILFLINEYRNGFQTLNTIINALSHPIAVLNTAISGIITALGLYIPPNLTEFIAGVTEAFIKSLPVIAAGVFFIALLIKRNIGEAFKAVTTPVMFFVGAVLKAVEAIRSIGESIREVGSSAKSQLFLREAGYAVRSREAVGGIANPFAYSQDPGQQTLAQEQARQAIVKGKAALRFQEELQKQVADNQRELERRLYRSARSNSADERLKALGGRQMTPGGFEFPVAPKVEEFTNRFGFKQMRLTELGRVSVEREARSKFTQDSDEAKALRAKAAKASGLEGAFRNYSNQPPTDEALKALAKGESGIKTMFGAFQTAMENLHVKEFDIGEIKAGKLFVSTLRVPEGMPKDKPINAKAFDIQRESFMDQFPDKDNIRNLIPAQRIQAKLDNLLRSPQTSQEGKRGVNSFQAGLTGLFFDKKTENQQVGTTGGNTKITGGVNTQVPKTVATGITEQLLKQYADQLQGAFNRQSVKEFNSVRDRIILDLIRQQAEAISTYHPKFKDFEAANMKALTEFSSTEQVVTGFGNVLLRGMNNIVNEAQGVTQDANGVAQSATRSLSQTIFAATGIPAFIEKFQLDRQLLKRSQTMARRAEEISRVNQRQLEDEIRLRERGLTALLSNERLFNPLLTLQQNLLNAYKTRNISKDQQQLMDNFMKTRKFQRDFTAKELGQFSQALGHLKVDTGAGTPADIEKAMGVLKTNLEKYPEIMGKFRKMVVSGIRPGTADFNKMVGELDTLIKGVPEFKGVGVGRLTDAFNALGDGTNELFNAYIGNGKFMVDAAKHRSEEIEALAKALGAKGIRGLRQIDKTGFRNPVQQLQSEIQEYLYRVRRTFQDFDEQVEINLTRTENALATGGVLGIGFGDVMAKRIVDPLRVFYGAIRNGVVSQYNAIESGFQESLKNFVEGVQRSRVVTSFTKARTAFDAERKNTLSAIIEQSSLDGKIAERRRKLQERATELQLEGTESAKRQAQSLMIEFERLRDSRKVLQTDLFSKQFKRANITDQGEQFKIMSVLLTRSKGTVRERLEAAGLQGQIDNVITALSRSLGMTTEQVAKLVLDNKNYQAQAAKPFQWFLLKQVPNIFLGVLTGAATLAKDVAGTTLGRTVGWFVSKIATDVFQGLGAKFGPGFLTTFSKLSKRVGDYLNIATNALAVGVEEVIGRNALSNAIRRFSGYLGQKGNQLSDYFGDRVKDLASITTKPWYKQPWTLHALNAAQKIGEGLVATFTMVTDTLVRNKGNIFKILGNTFQGIKNFVTGLFRNPELDRVKREIETQRGIRNRSKDALEVAKQGFPWARVVPQSAYTQAQDKLRELEARRKELERNLVAKAADWAVSKIQPGKKLTDAFNSLSSRFVGLATDLGQRAEKTRQDSIKLLNKRRGTAYGSEMYGRDPVTGQMRRREGTTYDPKERIVNVTQSFLPLINRAFAAVIEKGQQASLALARMFSNFAHDPQQFIRPLQQAFAWIGEKAPLVGGKLASAFAVASTWTQNAWERTVNFITGRTWFTWIKNAIQTGKSLVDRLNHGASDVTSAAWQRTQHSTQANMQAMAQEASSAGGKIAGAMQQSAQRSSGFFKHLFTGIGGIGKTGMAIGGAVTAVGFGLQTASYSLANMGIISEETSQKLYKFFEIFSILGVVGGIVTPIIGVITTSFGTLVSISAAVATGITGIGTAIASLVGLSSVAFAPLLLGVAAVAVAVASLYFGFRNNFLGIRSIVSGLGVIISSTLSTPIYFIQSAWQGFVNQFGAKLMPIVQPAIDIAQRLINALNHNPTQRIPEAWEAMKERIGNVFHWMSDTANSIGNSIGSGFRATLSFITNPFKHKNEAVKPLPVATANQSITEKVTGSVGNYLDKLLNSVNLIRESISWMTEVLKEMKNIQKTVETLLRQQIKIQQIQLAKTVFDVVANKKKNQELYENLLKNERFRQVKEGIAATPLIQRAAASKKTSGIRQLGTLAGTITGLTGGPIFALLSGITTITAAVGLLAFVFSTDFLEIRTITGNVVGFIVNLFTGSVAAITSAWTGFSEWFGQLPLVEQALDIAQGLINALNHNPTERIPAAWESAGNEIKQEMWSWVDVAKGVGKAAFYVFTALVGGFSGLIVVTLLSFVPFAKIFEIIRSGAKMAQTSLRFVADIFVRLIELGVKASKLVINFGAGARNVSGQLLKIAGQVKDFIAKIPILSNLIQLLTKPIKFVLTKLTEITQLKLFAPFKNFFKGLFADAEFVNPFIPLIQRFSAIFGEILAPVLSALRPVGLAFSPLLKLVQSAVAGFEALSLGVAAFPFASAVGGFVAIASAIAATIAGVTGLVWLFKRLHKEKSVPVPTEPVPQEPTPPTRDRWGEFKTSVGDRFTTAADATRAAAVAAKERATLIAATTQQGLTAAKDKALQIGQGAVDLTVGFRDLLTDTPKAIALMVQSLQVIQNTSLLMLAALQNATSILQGLFALNQSALVIWADNFTQLISHLSGIQLIPISIESNLSTIFEKLSVSLDTITLKLETISGFVKPAPAAAPVLGRSVVRGTGEIEEPSKLGKSFRQLGSNIQDKIASIPLIGGRLIDEGKVASQRNSTIVKEDYLRQQKIGLNPASVSPLQNIKNIFSLKDEFQLSIQEQLQKREFDLYETIVSGSRSASGLVRQKYEGMLTQVEKDGRRIDVLTEAGQRYVETQIATEATQKTGVFSQENLAKTAKDVSWFGKQPKGNLSQLALKGQGTLNQAIQELPPVSDSEKLVNLSTQSLEVTSQMAKVLSDILVSIQFIEAILTPKRQLPQTLLSPAEAIPLQPKPEPPPTLSTFQKITRWAQGQWQDRARPPHYAVAGDEVALESLRGIGGQIKNALQDEQPVEYKSLQQRVKELFLERFEQPKGVQSRLSGRVGEPVPAVQGAEPTGATLAQGALESQHAWTNTTGMIASRLTDLVGTAETEGYNLQKAVSEGSPGPTYWIREHWKGTTESISGWLTSLSKKSEVTGTAIAANLETPPPQVVETIVSVPLDPKTPSRLQSFKDQIVSTYSDIATDVRDRFNYLGRSGVGGLGALFTPGIEQASASLAILGGDIASFATRSLKALVTLNFGELADSAKDFGGNLLYATQGIAASFKSMSLSVIAFGAYGLASISPFLLVLGGVTFTAAVLFANFLGLRTIIVGVFKVGIGLAQILWAALKGVASVVGSLGQIFVGVIRGLVTGDFALLRTGISNLKAAFTNFKADVWRGFQTLGGGIAQILDGIAIGIGHFSAPVEQFLRNVVTNLKNIATRFKTFLTSFETAEQLGWAIADNVINALKRLLRAAAAIPGQLKNIAIQTAKEFQVIITSGFNNARAKISGFFDSLKTFSFKEFISRFRVEIGGMPNDLATNLRVLRGIIAEQFNKLSSVITRPLRAMGGFLRGVFNRIGEELSDEFVDRFRVGLGQLKQVWVQIPEQLQALRSRVGEFVSNLGQHWQTLKARLTPDLFSNVFVALNELGQRYINVVLKIRQGWQWLARLIPGLPLFEGVFAQLVSLGYRWYLLVENLQNHWRSFVGWLSSSDPVAKLLARIDAFKTNWKEAIVSITGISDLSSFSAKAIAAIDRIQSAWKSFTGYLQHSALFPQVWEGLEKLGGQFTQAMRNLTSGWETVRTKFASGDLFVGIFSKIKSLGERWSNFVIELETRWRNLAQKIPAIPLFEGLFTPLWELGERIQQFAGWLQTRWRSLSVFIGTTPLIPGTLSLLEKLGAGFTSLISRIKTHWTPFVEFLNTTDLFNKAFDGLRWVAGNIPNWFETIRGEWVKLTSSLPASWGEAIAWIESKWAAFKQFFQGIFDKVTGIASWAAKTLIDLLNHSPTERIPEAWRGAVERISGSLNTLIAPARFVANLISGFFRKSSTESDSTVTSIERVGNALKGLGVGTRVNRDVGAHLKTLGLDTMPASIDQLKATYRQLSLTAHPDLGGNADQFHQIRTAYEQLRGTLERGDSGTETTLFGVSGQDIRKLQGEIEGLGRAFEQTKLFLSVFAEEFTKQVSPAIERLQPSLTNMVELLSRFGGGVRQVVNNLIDLFSRTKPATEQVEGLVLVGSRIEATIAPAFVNLTAIAELLGKTFGFVGSAVIGLLGKALDLGVFVSNLTESVTRFTASFVEAFSTKAQPILQELLPPLGKIVKVVGRVQALILGLSLAITAIPVGVVVVLTKQVIRLADKLGLVERVSALITTAFDALKHGGARFGEVVGDVAVILLGHLKNLLQVLGTLGDFLTQPLKGVDDLWRSLGLVIRGDFTGAFQVVQDVVTTTRTQIQSVADAIKSALLSPLQAIETAWESTIGRLGGLVQNLTSRFKGSGEQLETDLGEVPAQKTWRFWQRTTNQVGAEVQTLADKSAAPGHELQANIAEGSPGTTRWIRFYWAKTTGFVKDQLGEIAGTAQIEGERIESALTVRGIDVSGSDERMKKLGGSARSVLMSLGGSLSNFAPQLATPIFMVNDFVDTFVSIKDAIPEVREALGLAGTASQAAAATTSAANAIVATSEATKATAAQSAAIVQATSSAEASAATATAGGVIGGINSFLARSYAFLGKAAAFAYTKILLPLIKFLPLAIAVSAAVFLIYKAFQTNFLGISTLVQNVGFAFQFFFGKLFYGAWDAVASIFRTIDLAIRSVVDTIVSVASTLMAPFQPLLDFLGFGGYRYNNAAFAALAALADLLLVPLRLITGTINLIIRGIAFVINAVIRVGGVIAAFLLMPFALVVTAIVAIAQGINQMLQIAGRALDALLIAPAMILMNVSRRILGVFHQWGYAILNWILKPFYALANFMSPLFSKLKPIGDLLGWIGSLLGKVFLSVTIGIPVMILAVSFVITALSSLMSMLLGLAISAIPMLIGVVSALASTLFFIATAVIPVLLSALMGLFTTTVGFVLSTVIPALWVAALPIMTATLSMAATLAGALWSLVIPALGAVFAAVVPIVVALAPFVAIALAVAAAVGLIWLTFKGLSSLVGSVLVPLLRGVWGVIQTIGQAVFNFLVTPFQLIWGFVQKISQGIGNFLSGIPLIGGWFQAKPQPTPVQGLRSGGMVHRDLNTARIAALAGGGAVRGQGTSTGDRVMIAASPGEYMINAAATAANYGLLESVNEGAVFEPVTMSPTLPVAPPPLAVGSTVVAAEPTELPPIQVNLEFSGDIVVQGATGVEAAREFLDAIDPMLQSKMRELLRDLVEKMK